MIGQSNHAVQTENRSNAADGAISLKNANNPHQVNGSQVCMHTIGKNIVKKVRNEVNSVTTAVGTRVQDAILTAIQNTVIVKVELAMKSTKASSF